MKPLYMLVALFCSSQALASEIKIAFGSCLHQDKPQPIWSAINQEQADLFMLLGDNVYGDTEDMQILAEKYRKQSAVPGFQTLREQSQLIGIWDDHDYGENDAGREYPQKEASRQLMLDFFHEPPNSARRTRASGAYTSYILGAAPKRVQIILPDLRWNRSPLKAVSRSVYNSLKAPKNLGPYLPQDSDESEMLGEQQWQWLEEQLKQPAEIRIIASSLQVLPEFTGWESWANFPKERSRLLALLDKYQIEAVLMVSGDTHWGELSHIERDSGRQLYELTASGLTETWKQISPNKHRIGQGYAKPNYGVLEIEWSPSPKVKMSLKDVKGNTLIAQSQAF